MSASTGMKTWYSSRYTVPYPSGRNSPGGNVQNRCITQWQEQLHGTQANDVPVGSLFDAGIIDPTKVVRVALENVVSVASVLLLMEATMTEIPSETKATAGAALDA